MFKFKKEYKLSLASEVAWALAKLLLQFVPLFIAPHAVGNPSTIWNMKIN